MIVRLPAARGDFHRQVQLVGIVGNNPIVSIERGFRQDSKLIPFVEYSDRHRLELKQFVTWRIVIGMIVIGMIVIPRGSRIVMVIELAEDKRLGPLLHQRRQGDHEDLLPALAGDPHMDSLAWPELPADRPVRPRGHDLVLQWQEEMERLGVLFDTWLDVANPQVVASDDMLMVRKLIVADFDGDRLLFVLQPTNHIQVRLEGGGAYEQPSIIGDHTEGLSAFDGLTDGDIELFDGVQGGLFRGRILRLPARLAPWSW